MLGQIWYLHYTICAYGVITHSYVKILTMYLYLYTAALKYFKFKIYALGTSRFLGKKKWVQKLHIMSSHDVPSSAFW